MCVCVCGLFSLFLCVFLLFLSGWCLAVVIQPLEEAGSSAEEPGCSSQLSCCVRCSPGRRKEPERDVKNTHPGMLQRARREKQPLRWSVWSSCVISQVADSRCNLSPERHQPDLHGNVNCSSVDGRETVTRWWADPRPAGVVWPRLARWATLCAVRC